MRSAKVTMLYVVNIIINAAINGRHGALYSGAGVLLLILVWFYNLLGYQGFFEINHILLSLGYLLTFTINALAISYKKIKTGL